MVVRAWSVEDVRAAEEAGMAPLPAGELMRRASRGLAKVCAARVGKRARVVVLAGAGGNGGDALYAGAKLSRTSRRVTAVLVAARAHAPALAAARVAGVRVLEATTPEGLDAALAALARADLVIDGILGIGGRPDLGRVPRPDAVAPAEAPDGAAGSGGDGEGDPPAWRLVRAIPDEAYVIAVDLPSGTDPDGATRQSRAVCADETVTFSLPKGVHLLAGADACGRLTVVDIGIETAAAPLAESLEHDDVAARWPVPTRADDKYRRGVLGVVAGGQAYTGAALLAVTAAVCAGAGMVRYVGPLAPTRIIRAAVPEAVHGVGRVQAWVVGPGLDPEPDTETGARQVAAARSALDSHVPCLVDAGGLDLLDGPRAHAEAGTLLTPHAGELARLLARIDPDRQEGGAAPTAADVVARPIEHARRAADLLEATVLLKGATTYVVPPARGGPVRAQSNAPAWLATAGAGDVLAGVAGALLASGVDPLEAGSLAALVHGAAGDEANPGGPVRALEVAHAVPRVVARLLRRPALRGR